MPYKLALRGGLLVALFVLASLMVPAKALAQTGCLPDVGTRMPVLFVHGFNSSKDMWDLQNPKSLYNTLDRDDRLFSTWYDYEYERKRWVDFENLGGRLAKEIACRAESSRAAGGPGKIIVVAHSMGGLATKYAASQVINGRKVADDLGLVVTIGTPYKGSGAANDLVNVLGVCKWIIEFVTGSPTPLCQPSEATLGLRVGSDELKRLRPWPAGIPVLTIAGDLTMQVPMFLTVIDVDSESDYIVLKHSALTDGRSSKKTKKSKNWSSTESKNT
ncbi:MAG: alpha/beta fold hydrolase [Candidatus Saccharimonadales bacterium]